MELEKKVTEVLAKLGVPRNIKGFNYLREAIMLCTEDKKYAHNIVKLLYPTIAQNHSDKPARVERAIRHAIELACSKNPVEIEQIFHKREKPCNSEFIATIVDDLRLGVL